MTREELISLTIDKYTDLQRIKKSNGGVENKELDYQIKVTLAKLSSHELCGGQGESQYNTRGENAEGLINLMPSIEKLETVTGWKPEVDFKTGITRMIALRKRTI